MQMRNCKTVLCHPVQVRLFLKHTAQCFRCQDSLQFRLPALFMCLRVKFSQMSHRLHCTYTLETNRLQMPAEQMLPSLRCPVRLLSMLLKFFSFSSCPLLICVCIEDADKIKFYLFYYIIAKNLCLFFDDNKFLYLYNFYSCFSFFAILSITF